MKDPTSDRHILGDRLEQAAVEIMVEASDILRTVWALRRMAGDEEDRGTLTHDGSGLPGDMAISGCDDEPPEAHGPAS